MLNNVKFWGQPTCNTLPNSHKKNSGIIYLMIISTNGSPNKMEIFVIRI